MKKYSFLLFSVLMVACSGIRVFDTESAPGADFTQYKTVGFYETTAKGDTISNLFAARLDILKESIAREMQRRGFVQTVTNPALLINIGISVKEQVSTRETNWATDGAPRYMGQRNYSWKSETVETSRYREGSVQVELVDAVQKKMLWKGVVQGIVPGKNNAVQKEAQKGMEKLFARFPVAVK
jgi:hypothetical protein